MDGYLFGHNEARETFQLLEAERAAASRAGVKGVELVDLGEAGAVDKQSRWIKMDHACIIACLWGSLLLVINQDCCISGPDLGCILDSMLLPMNESSWQACPKPYFHA